MPAPAGFGGAVGAGPRLGGLTLQPRGRSHTKRAWRDRAIGWRRADALHRPSSQWTSCSLDLNGERVPEFLVPTPPVAALLIVAVGLVVTRARLRRGVGLLQ